MNWNLSDAKKRLGEVLDRAERDGPQTITRRGEAFVLVRADQYKELTGQKPSFIDWLLKGPRIDELKMPSRDGAVS